MKKTFKLMLLGLAMIGLGTAALPAGQANATAHCAYGNYICIWDGANFSGSVLRQALPGAGGCANVAAWADNMASSVANASGYEVMLYPQPGCGGNPLWIGAFTEYSDLNVFGYTNQISSFKRL